MVKCVVFRVPVLMLHMVLKKRVFRKLCQE